MHQCKVKCTCINKVQLGMTVERHLQTRLYLLLTVLVARISRHFFLRVWAIFYICFELPDHTSSCEVESLVIKQLYRACAHLATCTGSISLVFRALFSWFIRKCAIFHKNSELYLISYKIRFLELFLSFLTEKVLFFIKF